jgi:hypothetical protein
MFQIDLERVKERAAENRSEAFDLLRELTSRAQNAAEMCACAECYANTLKSLEHATQCLNQAELVHWWDIDSLLEIARCHLPFSRNAAARCLLKATVLSMINDEELLPCFGSINPDELANRMTENDWNFAQSSNTRDVMKTLTTCGAILQSI